MSIGPSAVCTVTHVRVYNSSVVWFAMLRMSVRYDLIVFLCTPQAPLCCPQRAFLHANTRAPKQPKDKGERPLCLLFFLGAVDDSAVTCCPVHALAGACSCMRIAVHYRPKYALVLGLFLSARRIAPYLKFYLHFARTACTIHWYISVRLTGPTTFKANTALAGGAIFNAGVTTFPADTMFVDNDAEVRESGILILHMHIFVSYLFA